MANNIQAIMRQVPDENTLWSGAYKIPWDDPEFSRRMLAEHLSQDHDMASRKQVTIDAQVKWIHDNIRSGKPGRLLDIGCGPGLYLERLVGLGYECTGIDFSPASVEYAQSKLGDRARVVPGDVRTTDFGEGYDVAMFVYGELNVFSPEECRSLLRKARESLAPGGTLLAEVHTYDTVKRVGELPNNWYRSGKGLTGVFSSKPHLCLIEATWFENHHTALQQYHVIDAASGEVQTYRGAARAYTPEEYRGLLDEAGLVEVRLHKDWPVHNDDLVLYSGVRG